MATDATSGETDLTAPRRVPGVVVTAALVLLAGEVGAAGSFAEKLDDCLDSLVPYGEAWSSRRGETRLSLRRGDGALLYLGVAHTRNPAHPDIDRIAREFRGFRPDLVLFEGHDKSVAADGEATVRSFGEAGWLRKLALDAAVETARLEPDPGREIGYLAGRFGAERVRLWFVMREAVLLRERRGRTEDEIRARIGQALEEGTIPGPSAGIVDLDSLDRAFWRHWPYPRRWWETPSEWVNPLYGSERTGSRFVNDVERASAGYRDAHMTILIARAVATGRRVFAVVGQGHLPMQAPALRCALE